MKKKVKVMDWKETGRFFSFLLNLFTVIRDTLVAQSINLEIIDWLTGEGKERFVEEFLKPLSKRFLVAQRVTVVSEGAISVNLEVPPILPHADMMAKPNKGGGSVMVERRSDGLYVDGHKIVLYLSKSQRSQSFPEGYDIYKEVVDLPVLHPNIMDALCEYNHLIPEDWKNDEGDEKIIWIYFWGVIYYSQDQKAGPFVRYLYWRRRDGWRCGYEWIGFRSSCYGLAAILES